MHNEQEVRLVYASTRAFFKRTAVNKSNNKRYADWASISPQKRARRLQGEAYGDTYRQGLLGYKVSHPEMTAVQYGRMLYNEWARAAGNCEEMSSVALYLFSVMAPGIPLHIISIGSPGDHQFLIAGFFPDALRQEPNNKAINLTRIPVIAASWVLDVWAGIFCRSAMYPAELWRKMERWATQGKLVWSENAFRDLRTWNYTSTMLTSQFECAGPDDPMN